MSEQRLIKINERWAIRSDPHQWILCETYMTAGGRNPRTGEEVGPRHKVRETYHAKLHQAISAAIEAEGKYCEELEDLLELTESWREIARDMEAMLS